MLALLATILLQLTTPNNLLANENSNQDPAITAAQLNNIAARQIKRGEFKKGLSNLNKAISLNKNIVRFYSNRANAYMGLRNYRKAELDFKTVLLNNSRDTSALKGLADALYFQGKHNESVKYYKKAIDSNRNCHECYSQIGSMYGTGGYNDYAISHLTKSIEIKPSYSAYLNRGIAYGRAGDARKSLADFRRAIELNPKGSQAYEGVCSTLGFLGNFEGAIGACNRSIELNNKSASAYMNRAIVLDNMLREYDALEDVKMAVKLNPNLESAKLMLSDLKALLEE